MISLFIDANVYLRFYAYTDDDLSELEKLDALVDAGKLRIYKNTQLEDEIERNREAKIEAALKTFKNDGPGIQIPRFASHFKKAQDLLDLSKKLKKAKSELGEQIAEEINGGDLRADKLIQKILSKAESLDIDEKILNAARWRQIRGNPPGKPDSIGDQLHWEALLAGAQNGEDLHIVSLDGDFGSKLNQGLPNPRLVAEWKSTKGGELHIFVSLGGFAKKHFDSISLPSDVTKSSAISKLVTTGTFENTHKQIVRLDGVFDEITLEEAQILFQAMIDNGQIRWIATDSDVADFYEKLFVKFGSKTPFEMDAELEQIANYFVLDIPF